MITQIAWTAEFIFKFHFMRRRISNGIDNIIDIELLFPAVHEVPGSTDAPINIAPVRAFEIVVCVSALGHDPILANAAFAPLELVVQEYFAR